VRTENYTHGVVSIFLVLALVFSMVTIAAPLASAGDWTNRPQPGGDIMSVVAGDTFTITHELLWDETGVDGAYTVTIAWDCYDNNPDENLTFISASATFTSGTYNGQSILAQTVLASSPSGANTRYALSVSCPADQKDNRDGDFDVDIVMGAYGVGAVAHTADPLESGDNHPILAQLGGVIVIESGLDSWNRAPITIKVIDVGVTVDISPDSQTGFTGENLSYTVTVTNTGELDDNYDLVLSDTLGWTLSITPSTLSIPAGDNDTSTLSVTVGPGSTTVTVTADGVYADNSDTCIANQYCCPPFSVEITPYYQENYRGGTLDYTVTVWNWAFGTDNYTLCVEDTEGWNCWLQDNYMENVGVYPENESTTLIVTVPENAAHGIEDTIKVTATSQKYYWYSRSDLCVARAVSWLTISPSYQSSLPGEALYYTVTVKNTGNVEDNYDLTVSDNAGWNPTWAIVSRILPTDDTTVTEGSPDNVADNGVRYNMYNGWDSTYLSQRPYLQFDISEVPHGMWIKSATLWANSKYGCSEPDYTDTWHLVDAMSVEDDNWSESTLTWNNAPSVVDVLDTENFQGDLFVGQHYWYSWDVSSFVESELYVDQVVSLALVRQEPEDAYASTGWFYTKDAPSGYEQYFPHLEIVYIPGPGPSTTVSLDAGENVTLCFGVVVPENATPCENDLITVTATSTENAEISENASCIAHVQVVRGVEVIIEPDNQPGLIGENVVFTVTVKNTGNVWDNYNLTPSDDAGWALELDNDYLEIPENENRETKLTVFVPDNEDLVCTTDNVTIVATAVDNAEVTDNDTVTVHAKQVWTGTAVFSLVNLYTVNVEMILDIENGSRLVVKFYTYADAFENENVIENFTPPWHVEENAKVKNPKLPWCYTSAVKKARLDLTTDDTENAIATVVSFTVTKTILEIRFTQIPLEWAITPLAEKWKWEKEFSDIPICWALAPP